MCIPGEWIFMKGQARCDLKLHPAKDYSIWIHSPCQNWNNGPNFICFNSSGSSLTSLSFSSWVPWFRITYSNKRDNPAIKSARILSYRGPEFGFQYPHPKAHNHLVPGDPTVSSSPLAPLYTWLAFTHPLTHE